MAWYGTLTVRDCATKQAIQLVVVSADTPPAVGAKGEFIVAVDDSFPFFSVIVQSPGYVSESFKSHFRPRFAAGAPNN
jgi:hypothetical protein